MYLRASVATAIALLVSFNVCAKTYGVSGVLTVRDANNTIVGPSDLIVYGTYDTGRLWDEHFPRGPMSLATTQPYFGNLWSAQVSTYSAGFYRFDACLDDGSINCIRPTFLNMNVDSNQWGGHFLMDWSINKNIDIVSVWDVSFDRSADLALEAIHLTSTDPDGDGILGVPMLDGPFKGFSWSYDLTITPQAVPVPPAIWLLGSGIIGLIGVGRRSTKAM